MVRARGMEPSTISGLSVDGSAQQLVPPNSFAQTPESGDTAAGGCGQGLRTERPGQATHRCLRPKDGPGYAPHRLLTAERRKRLQIAITAACSLNKVMVVSFTK